MAAKTTITHRDIVDSIRKGQYAPVYLLMGEEPYYIDRISEYIEENILKPEERDFNQQVIYCTDDTQVADIVNAAKRYPMMAEHQVLIVKEAQNLLKNLDEFVPYINHPQTSTILVICYKHGTVDRRKKFVAAVEKNGVVYESAKVRESALPQFITDYLNRRKVAIQRNACMLMVEAIGADLSRMAGELDKLIITLPEDSREITAEHIEKNIGISKDFNAFELKNAIMAKDVFKANQIMNYMNDNPKLHPAQPTLALLFNTFSALMLAYYAPDKSMQGMMEQLGVRSDWMVKQYQGMMQHYSAMKTMLIIGKIRETDAKLKGVGKGNADSGDLMRELLFFILH